MLEVKDYERAMETCSETGGMSSAEAADLAASAYVDPPTPRVTVRGKMMSTTCANPTSLACCLVDLLQNHSRFDDKETTAAAIADTIGGVVVPDRAISSKCGQIEPTYTNADDGPHVSDSALRAVHVKQAPTKYRRLLLVSLYRHLANARVQLYSYMSSYLFSTATLLGSHCHRFVVIKY